LKRGERGRVGLVSGEAEAAQRGGSGSNRRKTGEIKSWGVMDIRGEVVNWGCNKTSTGGAE